jgi:hypothetical protein
VAAAGELVAAERKIVSGIGMQRSPLQLLGTPRHVREIDVERVRDDYTAAIREQAAKQRDKASQPELDSGSTGDLATQGNVGTSCQEEQ